MYYISMYRTCVATRSMVKINILLIILLLIPNITHAASKIPTKKKCVLLINTPYKTKKQPTIFFITPQCTKRIISSAPIYFEYFSSWKKTRVTSDALLKKIPADPDGALLSKISSTSDVIQLSTKEPEQNQIISPLSTALKDVYNINWNGSELPQEKSCISRTTFRGDTKFISEQNIALEKSSVLVRAYTDVDTPAARSDVVTNGITNWKNATRWLETNFGQYPCTELTLIGYVDDSRGSPGYLINGSKSGGGLEQKWLMYHESTHAYFHSDMHSSWFAEGTASVLPSFIIIDQINNKQASWKDLGYAEDNSTPDLYTFISEKEYPVNAVAGLIKVGLTLDSASCEVESDYAKGSYFGRELLERLYLQTGRQRFLAAMNLIYTKYRITSKKLTNNDIAQAFNYYASLEQKSMVAQLLQNKLCLKF